MNIKIHFLYSVEYYHYTVVPLLSGNVTLINMWNQGDAWYVVCVY